MVRAAAHTVRGGLVSTGTAHTTAMGRVLLAEVSDDTLNQFMNQIEFKPYTPYSITSESALRTVLARVREQNYALLDQEPDFCAAPCFQSPRWRAPAAWRNGSRRGCRGSGTPVTAGPAP